MNSLEICNGLHGEMEGISSTGFPLDVFPPLIQKVLLDFVQHDGQNVELLATAMLSAMATAIGNAFVVHVRGNWYTNCVLFFVLVARPGTGKTPTLSFAFAPIRERDAESASKFVSELEAYKSDLVVNGKASTASKPHLQQKIIDDFTPETLYRTSGRKIILAKLEHIHFFGFLKSRPTLLLVYNALFIYPILSSVSRLCINGQIQFSN